MSRLRTTLRDRLFIQNELLARLKRGPLGFAALCRIGTPEQTRRELDLLVEAGLVAYDQRRSRYRYLGLDQKLRPSGRVAEAAAPTPEASRGKGRR
jgi:DNA-binding IclR family transcriptional regulator